jgi:hypothetical protein
MMIEAVRTAGLAGIACGDGSSGLPSRGGQTKLLSEKQELGGEKSHRSGKFPIVKKGKRKPNKFVPSKTQ